MKTLRPQDLDKDPLIEFQKWFDRASKVEGLDADAMTLATATRFGRPSARMVLFKGLEQGQFLFYTNYNSQKSKTLHENPHAALVFYWHPLYQQIRIEGKVEKVSRKNSEDYFKTRARASQLSAIASAQSSVISNRDELLENYRETEKKFEGRDVECPAHWGGFQVKPEKIEFWIGQINRLHDRVLYTLESGNWNVSYLSP